MKYLLGLVLLVVPFLILLSCHGDGDDDSNVVIIQEGEGDREITVIVDDNQAGQAEVDVFISDDEIRVIIGDINHTEEGTSSNEKKLSHGIDFIDLDSSTLKLLIDDKDEFELLPVTNGYETTALLDVGTHTFSLLICDSFGSQLFKSPEQTIVIQAGIKNDITFIVSASLHNSMGFQSINTTKKESNKLSVTVGVSNATGASFTVHNNNDDLEVKKVSSDFPNKLVSFEVGFKSDGTFIVIIELKKTHSNGVTEIVQKELSFSKNSGSLFVEIFQSPKLKSFTVLETIEDGCEITLELLSNDPTNILWYVDNILVQNGGLNLKNIEDSSEVEVILSFTNSSATTSLKVLLSKASGNGGGDDDDDDDDKDDDHKNDQGGGHNGGSEGDGHDK